MKLDINRFRNIAAGFQSIVVTIAVIIGGAWTLYTFSAFEEINRQKAELETLYRGLDERGILDITLTPQQQPGDGSEHRYLVVTVEITNRGNRTEVFNWDAGELLAARMNVRHDGSQT